MRSLIVGSIGLLLAAALPAAPVVAAETVSYSYDAKGRLVKVVKSGGPNAGVTVEYSYDRAHNRVRVKTTGAP